jgi:carbon storage regulator
MLVLSRKHLEKVIIDVPPSKTVTKIVVQVVDIQAGKIRLGIEAPRDVPVWRQEIYDAIQETAVRR